MPYVRLGTIFNLKNISLNVSGYIFKISNDVKFHRQVTEQARNRVIK